jgi:tripartite-type tricarboxylate transporter receptor subunit TctC
MSRKLLRVIAAACTASMIGGAQTSAQQASGRLIYPYAPGGIGDASARFIAQALSKGAGRTFIVDNRAGAGGRTGTRAVADATPDGNTLGYVTIALMSVFPIVFPNLNYDPEKDFAPVSQVAQFDIAMGTGPLVNAKTLGDFIAWVKANPDKGSYSTPAAGSLPHFFAVSVAEATGIRLQHVPYAGAPPAINDVIGGQLPMVVATTSDLAELHKAQKLTILGTSGQRRSHLVPEVPTFRELGYKIEGYGWFAVVAPAKTPPETVTQLSGIISAAMREPANKERINKLGMEPTGTTPAELAAIMKADREKWAPVVKASGFTPAK